MNKKVLYNKNYANYSVYHYNFVSVDIELNYAEDYEIFLRKTVTYSIDDIEMEIKAAKNIEEYDTLSYDTEFLLNYLCKDKIIGKEAKSINKLLVYEPSQGHIPVFLSKLYNPDFISLLSRDLLSLEFSKENLISNDFRENSIGQFHKATIKEVDDFDYDLVIWRIKKDIETELILSELDDIETFIDNFNNKRVYFIFVSTSAKITLIENKLKSMKDFSKIIRKKKKGYSFLISKATISLA